MRRILFIAVCVAVVRTQQVQDDGADAQAYDQSGNVEGGALRNAMSQLLPAGEEVYDAFESLLIADEALDGEREMASYPGGIVNFLQPPATATYQEQQAAEPQGEGSGSAMPSPSVEAASDAVLPSAVPARKKRHVCLKCMMQKKFGGGGGYGGGMAPVYQPQPQPVYHPQPQPVYHPQPQPEYHPQPQPVYHPQPQPQRQQCPVCSHPPSGGGGGGGFSQSSSSSQSSSGGYGGGWGK